MKKTEIQSIIQETINETLVQQQDNAERSACKTYSHLAREANDKLEKYQTKNELIHEKILEKLDTHLERYTKDREEMRVNNEAIFTQLKELTLEVKKNSDENSKNSSFRTANEKTLKSVNNGMITIQTNSWFILKLSGIATAIAALVYIIKQVFKG